MCAPDQQPLKSATPKTATITTTTTTTEKVTKNAVTNEKWILKRRPEGIFSPEKDAQFVTESLDLDCQEDEIIVESSYLSVDAFIRTMLDEEAYHGAINVGSSLPALGYGKVVAVGPSSKHKVGSLVAGMMGAQTYAKVKSKDTFGVLQFPYMTPTASLGIMGVTTGLTAYTGVFYVCRRPRKGETVVVTGAAGAVGSIAAQLAKSTGARVIGLAGGSRKKEYLLEELHLDGVLDYKCIQTPLAEQIDALCPEGIDFIYDNVGGSTLDVLLAKINPGGRVVICGAISQYSGNLNKGRVVGPSNYLKLAERGAEMKGFNVMQYMYKLPLAIVGMFYLYMRGKVQMTETVEKGIRSFPKALENLFTGGHIGKMLVHVNGNASSSSSSN